MNLSYLDRGDLCPFEDLEIGEAFYTPFMPAVVWFKTGPESYGLDPNEPEYDAMDVAFWVVGRVALMRCRRCGCTESHACFDRRLGSPCAWARPGLCTNCLTDAEFAECMRLGGHQEEAA